MKTLVAILGILGFLAPLLSTNAFAGVNYNQYHKDYEARKNIQIQPTGDHPFRHTSKYLREDDNPKTVVPSNPGANKFHHKYERSYWDSSAGR